MENHQKQSVELMFDAAKMKLAEDGKINPLFFIVLEDGIFQPVVIPQNGNISIEKYASLVITLAHANSAKGLGLLCEVNSDDNNPFLVFYYITDDGDSEALIGKIHKDKNTPYVTETSWSKNIPTTLITPWKLPEEKNYPNTTNQLFKNHMVTVLEENNNGQT